MPRPTFRPLEHAYRSDRPLRTLYGLLDRPWWYHALTMLVLAVKHSPVWVIPFLVARAINDLADPSAADPRQLILWFVAVVALIAQNVPTHTLYVSLLSGAVRDLERNLRSALVTRLQQLSIAFHDRTESGRLQAKVLRDVEQVQMFCMLLGDAGAVALMSFAFAVGVTALKEPRLLVFFLAMAPLVSLLRMLFGERMADRNTAFRSEIERMSSDVVEMLNMIPIVRAHGLEEVALVRMDAKFQAVNRRGRRLDLINALFGSSSWVGFQLAMVAALAVLVWFCLRGWISVGDIVLYQSLFGMMVNCVSQLLGIYPQLARGVESIRSIGEVLECPDLEHNLGRRAVQAVEGAVRFDHVTFAHSPGKPPSVAQFSLDVMPGECIALVGPSGAGKSTLVQLLIGFRRPQSGRILFDGQEMEDLDMRTVRRFVSVVPQETVLFSGTIRENIVYGVESCGEERLAAVLAAAQLADMVDSLPHGLDTRIGEDGALLSGGQRQRIAIARALIRDPRILVLDEATSALDVVSEKQVQEAIDRAVRNRTTFIVAHRLSTIRKASRIVVMKAGRIEEVGTYDDLMARRGFFYEMHRLQH